MLGLDRVVGSFGLCAGTLDPDKRTSRTAVVVRAGLPWSEARRYNRKVLKESIRRRFSKRRFTLEVLVAVVEFVSAPIDGADIGVVVKGLLMYK